MENALIEDEKQISNRPYCKITISKIMDKWKIKKEQ
jgi:hypothetical protein